MKAYIGTSGWMYKHWNKLFFPKELPKTEWLEYYSERFNTVEINSTFYHLAKKTSFQKWKGDVPRGFRYATKLNRLFTQYKRLILDEEVKQILFNILGNTAELKDRLGPVLIQLPPSFKYNPERLDAFLAYVRECADKLKTRFKFSVEFRHISWLNEDTYNILRKHKVAFCISDSPKWPTEIIKTAGFVYVRLHGNPKLYGTDYSTRELNAWAKKLSALEPKEIFIYFDNDKNAYAAKNSMYLKRLFG